MSASLRADWIAVNVEAPSMVKPSDSDLQDLSEHMRLAESLGAETVTLTGHRASEEILNYARDRNVTKIIIGKPTHPRWKDKVFGSLLDEVVRGSGDIDIYVITGDSGEAVPRPVAQPGQPATKPGEWLLSCGVVSCCTAVAALVRDYVTLVDVSMVFLLGIVIVASRAGNGLRSWQRS
ncbi:MAG: universal stress protein [Comamonadaceae bacterium]|nr:universal stress protein [Comamonadaceae bacterium]